MRTSTFACLLFAGLAAACGGDGPGSGPVTAADAEDGCRQTCERDIACDPEGETVEACTASCVGDVIGWVRADAFQAITDCAAALACGVSDDQCLTECEATAAHERYEAQCREVFAPCDLGPAQIDGFCETTPMPGVDGNDVGFFCVITPSIVDEMTACIPDGTACQAAITCISGVLEAHGIDG